MKVLAVCAALVYHTAVWAQPMQVFGLDALPTLVKNQRDPALETERQLARETHDKINLHRQSLKLQPLRWNDTLWLAARNHAIYLLKNKASAHNQEKGKAEYSGKSVQERVDYLLEGSKIINNLGENVYTSGFGSINSMPNDAFQAWLQSEPHKKNMEYAYQQQGVALLRFEHRVVAVAVMSLGSFRNAPGRVAEPNEHSAVMVAEPLYARQGLPSTTKPEEPESLTTSKLRKDMAGMFYYLQVKDWMPAQSKRRDDLNRKAEKWALALLQFYSRDREYREKLKDNRFMHDVIEEAVPAHVGQRLSGRYKASRVSVLVSFPETTYVPDKIKAAVQAGWMQTLQNRTYPMSQYGFYVGCKKKGTSYMVCATLEVV
jgi:uncharacterized protein YkwD